MERENENLQNMSAGWVYDAFISYRHTEPDRFIAENLHRQLEAFRLPRRIAGRREADKRGGNTRTRIRRVFRDKDELPLTNNLEDPIRKALEQSEYLIVICSPRLQESLWCKKEIETFIELHGREKILAVLAEGEPEEAFPEELLVRRETVRNPDGTQEVVEHRLEPLAADVRGKDKRAMLKAMRTEILRLLAPMFGLSYDALRQRHRERRLKRILTAALAVAGICIVFGTVSTTMALRINRQNEQIASQNDELRLKQEQIQSQNEQLLRNQALNLAENALDLLEDGDRVGALELAIQSLTEYGGMEMPHTARAQYALTEALHVYDSGNNLKALRQIKAKGLIDFMELSPDGKYLLTGDAAEGLVLWDVAECRAVGKLPDSLDCDEGQCAFLGNGRLAYRTDDYQMKIYDMETKLVSDLRDDSGGLTALYRMTLSEDGKYLAATEFSGVCVFDCNTMDEVFSSEAPLAENLTFHSGDSGIFAYSEKRDDRESVIFADVKENRILSVLETGEADVTQISFAGDTAWLLMNYVKDGYGGTDTLLWSCNFRTGEINWQKTFPNGYAFSMYQPLAEGAEHLLVESGMNALLIRMDDGSETEHFSMGSEMVGCVPLANSDIFLIFTRSGEYCLIDAESAMGFSRNGYFECHSRNLKEVYPAKGCFLVLPYRDNRVTVYGYSDAMDLEEIEEGVPEREQNFFEADEARSFAENAGLANAALVQRVCFCEEEGLYFVSYADGTLEIYKSGDMTLAASLSDIQDNILFCYGRDKADNLYVGGFSYGYILNTDYEILARVEGLASLNSEENYIVLQNGSSQYWKSPVYTLEELLAKAQGYVLK